MAQNAENEVLKYATEEAQKRAAILKSVIEAACVGCKLNLTVYDGKIGFVDQSLGKIVFLWEAEYSMQGHERN